MYTQTVYTQTKDAVCGIGSMTVVFQIAGFNQMTNFQPKNDHFSTLRYNFVVVVIVPLDLPENGLAASNFGMLGLGDIVIPG